MKNDFVIIFALSNGDEFYLDKECKPIPFNESISIKTLVETAKQYSYISSKVVTTKLWNKQILKHFFKEDIEIKKSYNFSLQAFISRYGEKKPYELLYW